jgi:hypothetical protein
MSTYTAMTATTVQAGCEIVAMARLVTLATSVCLYCELVAMSTQWNRDYWFAVLKYFDGSKRVASKVEPTANSTGTHSFLAVAVVTGAYLRKEGRRMRARPKGVWPMCRTS